MEKPKPKVDGMRTYFDVREMNAYLAWLEQENKRLTGEVEYWKRYTMMPK